MSEVSTASLTGMALLRSSVAQDWLESPTSSDRRQRDVNAERLSENRLSHDSSADSALLSEAVDAVFTKLATQNARSKLGR
jgi:hypothetical protein